MRKLWGSRSMSQAYPRFPRSACWALLAWLIHPRVAAAGMPSISLTDVARLRFEAISFFLLVLVACAFVIQRIWNGLQKDFPRLPRLSFGKAAGLVTLWGLLFLLVLTMISGARELMTPGAWKKQGLTYKLADSQPSALPAAPGADLIATRRQSLERLRDALAQYARGHDTRLPARSSPELDLPIWEVPDASGMTYLYWGEGQSWGVHSEPVAAEPEIFGKNRFVLLRNGDVVSRTSEQIRRAFGSRTP